MEDDRVHSSRRRALVKAGAAVAGGAALGLPIFAAGQSAAASWPNRSVRIVVPYGAGGTADIMSRIIGQQLSKQLGQPFVIENKGGASTTIGAADVARSPADGYTLIVVTPTFAVAQFVYPNLPFAAKDFTPVALFITTPLLLVVNPSLGFKTVGDYIKFAKANPGKITFASSGAGSTPHLGFELLMEQAGINLLHIPYKGGGEAVASVLSGTTDSYFSVPIESGPHIKAGKMRPLAITGLKRNSLVPDVPTFEELGFKGFDGVQWYGIVGPANMPPAIVTTLNSEINKMLADPSFAERLSAEALQPMPMTPSAFAQYIRDDIAKWTKVAKERNIQLTD